MNDSDVEELLRTYRLIGPPVRLRERVLAATRAPRVWPWLGAAAALLATIVISHETTRRRIAGGPLSLGPSPTTRLTEELTVTLGGGRRARDLAELTVVEQELRQTTASARKLGADVAGGVGQ